MIASLNICAAVHGTVDDNMAVHGKGDESEGQEGERKTTLIFSTVFHQFALHDTNPGDVASLLMSLQSWRSWLAREGIIAVYLLLPTGLSQAPRSPLTRCPRKLEFSTRLRGKWKPQVSTAVQIHV